MDLATIVSLISGAAFMVIGIVTGDQGWPALGNFWDLISVYITFGGTLSCMIGSNTFQSLITGLKSFVLTLKMPKFEQTETIKQIIDLSNVARKEGLLALEEAATGIEDPFMKKGILLIVDGTDPELLRAILETELICIESRHKKNIGFWELMGAQGPAWGMIGTLIGLINMLKVMNDPKAIGPAMAVALVTTFYGSVLANWICIPVATKLKAKNSSEIMVKELMVEGLLSIQAGENPRVIEEKLKSFLSPSRRAYISQREEGGESNG